MRTWIVLHLTAFVLVFLYAPELMCQTPLWLLLPALLCLLCLFCLNRGRRVWGRARLLLLVLLLIASGALHGGLRLIPYLASLSSTSSVDFYSLNHPLDVSGYFCALDFESQTKLMLDRARKRQRPVRLCFEVEKDHGATGFDGRRMMLDCTGCTKPVAGTGYRLELHVNALKRQLPLATPMEQRARAISRFK